MNLKQILASITTRQELKVEIGRGCRDITLCADGGVVCVMPDGEVKIIPRNKHNKHKGARLRVLVLIAGIAAGVYGLCASTFTGPLGPSHVIYAGFYAGAFLGLFSKWPRTIKEHERNEATRPAQKEATCSTN